MKNVVFKPWVGEKFESSKHKLLILGHTHHCSKAEECNCKEKASVHLPSANVPPVAGPHFLAAPIESCFGITVAVIQRYIEYKNGILKFEKWMNTFSNFINAVHNKRCDANLSIEFMNSIIFYNYLQYAVSSDKRYGTVSFDAYEMSKAAFLEVLNEYKPKHIIIWGSPLCDILQKIIPAVRIGAKIDEQRNGNVFYLPNGENEIPAYRTYHPSVSFARNEWNPRIQKFLNET